MPIILMVIQFYIMLTQSVKSNSVDLYEFIVYDAMKAHYYR